MSGVCSGADWRYLLRPSKFKQLIYSMLSPNEDVLFLAWHVSSLRFKEGKLALSVVSHELYYYERYA